MDLKSNVPFTIIFNLHYYPFTSDLCSPLVKLTNSVQLANQLHRAGIESAITFFFFFFTATLPDSAGTELSWWIVPDQTADQLPGPGIGK